MARSQLNHLMGMADTQMGQGQRAMLRPRGDAAGFTLIELTVGASILLLAIVTLLDAFGRQSILNTHSRNLTWAMNDASRVLERLRQLNTGAGCAAPSINLVGQPDQPPAGCPPGNPDQTCWDAWLTSAGGGGGKSIQPAPLTNELIVMSTNGADPIQVTVAVCWRSQERTLGECNFAGGVLTPNEGLIVPNDSAAIDSPAMLSTLVTCRS